MESGHYDYLTGYKATTAFMTCQNFQYELGVWYSIPESTTLEPCLRGFHFCIYPSGTRDYYNQPTDRVFICEAKDILVENTPGARLKCVARHIRLISEIHPSGDGNTGRRNTGCHNTGDYNTGNKNTGNKNTGNKNTGHSNKGNGNVGDGNTGDWNTGNSNTGDWNTGNSNTGDANRGYRNTGNHNTGHRNTGRGNTTNNCTGFFCAKEPEVLCFDKPTGLTRSEFFAKYGTLIGELARELVSLEKFDYTAYKALPGWSLRGIEALHKTHLKGRQS